MAAVARISRAVFDFGVLQAAFLNESRTLGHFQSSVREIRVRKVHFMRKCLLIIAALAAASTALFAQTPRLAAHLPII